MCVCVAFSAGNNLHHYWLEDGSLEIRNATRRDAGLYTIKCENEEGVSQTAITLDVLCKTHHTQNSHCWKPDTFSYDQWSLSSFYKRKMGREDIIIPLCCQGSLGFKKVWFWNSSKVHCISLKLCTRGANDTCSRTCKSGILEWAFSCVYPGMLQPDTIAGTHSWKWLGTKSQLFKFFSRLFLSALFQYMKDK